MPITKSVSQYRYDTTGKLYPTRKQAVRQMRAIKASQARKGK